MPADQLRSRTVGCKMTEAEHERLNATAEEQGVTLGEWCREVLLQHANEGFCSVQGSSRPPSKSYWRPYCLFS